MERDITPTIEDCVEAYEKRNLVTIIENGQVLDVRKDV